LQDLAREADRLPGFLSASSSWHKTPPVRSGSTAGQGCAPGLDSPGRGQDRSTISGDRP